MRFPFPQSVKSDFDGYGLMLDLFAGTKDLYLKDIVLDFQNTSWFEANLTAVLGAILSNVSANMNDVRLAHLSGAIEKLFQRNHFLSHFGGYRIPDLYDTTIKYRKFKRTEEKLFKDYLDSELLAKEALPEMSQLLRKKINESIFEIFNNAVLHGDCKNVFSCGQYYPNKKRLDFTIVNLGRTIRRNVRDFLGKRLTGKEAILWAVAEGNTTKKGNIPGGLGLSLIREFLEKNKGKIQIVSSDGFWEQKGASVTTGEFPDRFVGTIVNLEFNINDESYYYLTSEINAEDIF